MPKITVKRIVPMFAVVTENFKKELNSSSLTELKMIDDQMTMIHSQIKQLQSRFGLLSNQSTKTAQDQINHTIMELNERLEQMKVFRQSMVASMEEMKNKPLGEQVQTGMIENYVELKPGDNIKEIFERAKIVIKDDIVQEIVE